MTEDKGNRIMKEIDEVKNDRVPQIEKTTTKLTPERTLLRDALAILIKQTQPLNLEVTEQEVVVSNLRGRIAMTKDKLEEADALHRTTEQKLKAVLAQQDVLATLFLGNQARSPKNSNGLTLEQAFQQNFDGLKDAVG